MLFPLVSVTAIGLVVAMVAWVVRGRLLASVLSSVAGAWTGFVAGGILGVLVDVVTASGDNLFRVGHVGAMVGAAVASVWETRLAAEPAVRDRQRNERDRAAVATRRGWWTGTGGRA